MSAEKLVEASSEQYRQLAAQLVALAADRLAMKRPRASSVECAADLRAACDAAFDLLADGPSRTFYTTNKLHDAVRETGDAAWECALEILSGCVEDASEWRPQ